MPMPGPGVSRRAFTLSAATVITAAAGCGSARTSPPAAAAAAASRTSPPNVRVSRDAFSGHIEPWLAVNPRQPGNLVAVSRAFQGSALGLASYASFDAGASWHSYGLLPGVTDIFDGNPTVAFDAAGHCYACGLTGRNVRQQQGYVLVWRSADGGRTFLPPVTAVDGFLDHPSLAADPAPGAPAAHLYLAGTFYNSPRNGLAFTRSADGGRTFEPPRFPDPVTGVRGILPATAAGPGGAVHIMYFVPAPDGLGNAVKVVTSTDRGAAFASPATLPLHAVSPPTPGNVITRCGPALAAAPDGRGVYAAIATYDTATSRSAIQLCYSLDRGRTWNPPVTVASSSQAVYFMPQVAAATRGHAAVSAFALAAGRVEVLLFTSQPGHPGFGSPLRVTSRSFDPTVGTSSGAGTYWLGNYQGLAAAPGSFHPIWTDTRTGQTQIFTAAIPAP
jgi:hypothetical protein